jgi:hypothetical protein
MAWQCGLEGGKEGWRRMSKESSVVLGILRTPYSSVPGPARLLEGSVFGIRFTYIGTKLPPALRFTYLTQTKAKKRAPEPDSKKGIRV